MRQYKEDQHFGEIIKWFMVTIILAVNLAVIVGFALEKSAATEEILSWIITPTILAFVVFIVFYTELKITYSSEKITYKLKPLEWKEKHIDKSEIQSISIKQFKWFQYGGFGKRIKLTSKSISYVMHYGPIAEVILKNGKIRRFSVKNKNQLNRFLKEHYEEVFGV